MTNIFTWKEGARNSNVYTRRLFFREICKCEVEGPPQDPPPRLWDSSVLHSPSDFSGKGKVGKETWTWRWPCHTYLHTWAVLLRVEKAVGVKKGRLTHLLTSFPTSLAKIPTVFSVKKGLIRESTVSTNSMPWVTEHFSEASFPGN